MAMMVKPNNSNGAWYCNDKGKEDTKKLNLYQNCQQSAWRTGYFESYP